MKNTTFRILSGLVLIVAIAGIAFFAYNAGVTQSAAQNAQPSPVNTMPYWRPFPFFGLGFFCLAMPFLFFLAWVSARLLWHGPRSGWHRISHRYAPWGDSDSGDGVPPMVAEMHRRMHAAEAGKPADPTPQK